MRKRIPIGAVVTVAGPANQPPFELVQDTGIILDNQNGYLVQLHKGRENQIFRRKDLIYDPELYKDAAESSQLPTQKKAKKQPQPYDPFNL